MDSLNQLSVDESRILDAMDNIICETGEFDNKDPRKAAKLMKNFTSNGTLIWR